MLTKDIEVNGTKFRLILTDQVVNQVHTLKDLYATAYEDPESFDNISSKISSVIQEISTSVEPPVSDGNLDGLIQQIIQAVDNKEAEIKQELSSISNSSKKLKKQNPKKRKILNKKHANSG